MSISRNVGATRGPVVVREANGDGHVLRVVSQQLVSQLLVTWGETDEHRTAGASVGHLELVTSDHTDSIDNPCCLVSTQTGGLASYATVEQPKRKRALGGDW